MKIQKSISYRCFTAFNAVFMIFMAIIMLYPMLYVLFASLSNSNAFMQHTGLLLAPLEFDTAAYKAVLENPMVWTGYRNTLFILVCGVIINMVMTTIAAFVLSRPGLPGKRQMTLFIMFTMYFGGGLIPTFLTVKSLGLYNNIWALIIPGAISTYNTIIMRTSFEGIPRSLEESAMLDGASYLCVLTRIMIPLSKAVMAVMVLYYAVGHWNSWFNAMIYLRERGKYPLQLVLREILIQGDTSAMGGGNESSTSLDQVTIAETIKYATIIVATVPILLIYPFLQKYFVKGVMIGAVKG